MKIRCFLILEQVRGDVPWRGELTDRPVEAEDGSFSPPVRPGIGAELVEAAADAHPGRSPLPHLAFGPNGGLLDWERW